MYLDNKLNYVFNSNPHVHENLCTNLKNHQVKHLGSSCELTCPRIRGTSTVMERFRKIVANGTEAGVPTWEGEGRNVTPISTTTPYTLD